MSNSESKLFETLDNFLWAYENVETDKVDDLAELYARAIAHGDYSTI